MVIHESDFAAVDFQPADSDAVWVFFNDGIAGDSALCGATTARRAGVASISIRIKAADAAPADLAPATTAISDALRDYRSVVALGQHGGGRAALRLGDAIGAGTVLAFSPVPPEDNSVEVSPDTTARRYVFRDRGLVGPEPCAVDIPLRHAGDATMELFAATPTLAALVAACRAGDLPALRRLSSHSRRTARGRATALARTLEPRRPDLAATIAAHNADPAGPAIVPPGPRAPMAGLPTVTVFGSCRVYNPCALLAAGGRIRLNQSNIFGFVHCAAEVLQQLRLISGETAVPSRLRPYLNIGDHWRTPAPATPDALARQFADTDVFVVEVSSIRHLRFKAFLLQINRTRELLAGSPEVLRDWWTPLLKTGCNTLEAIPPDCTPTVNEIMTQVTLVEQAATSIRHDIEVIARRLGKPVLFVSHFNIDMAGAPIAQRSTIVEAFAGTRFNLPCDMFDPTALVRAKGPMQALADAAHYQPAFEAELADVLATRIDALAMAQGRKNGA